MDGVLHGILHGILHGVPYTYPTQDPTRSKRRFPSQNCIWVKPTEEGTLSFQAWGSGDSSSARSLTLLNLLETNSARVGTLLPERLTENRFWGGEGELGLLPTVLVS